MSSIQPVDRNECERSRVRGCVRSRVRVGMQCSLTGASHVREYDWQILASVMSGSVPFEIGHALHKEYYVTYATL